MKAYPDARTLWFDGLLQLRDDVRIDPLSHGLHYGTGVFEGIRAYETPDGVAVFRLREHLDRLHASAAALGTPLPYDRDALTRAVEGVIAANGLRDAYIRPLAFLGASGLGLDARAHRFHVLVAAWGWGAYLGSEGLAKGIRLASVPRIKTSASMVPVAAKVCGNYVNSVLALREALEMGADEAILVNERGFLAEGTGENLFVVNGDRLRTPPVSDDLLPGITRDAVMVLAKEAGYACEERSLRPADLLDADEVFLTGTAAEVTPVRSIDGRSVGTSTPGPVTQRLQSAFFDAVRGRGEWGARHAEWRHVVRSVLA